MAIFDDDGFDRDSYAPVVLMNDEKFENTLLMFDDWAYLHGFVGADRTTNGLALDGHGVDGIVRAAMLDAGLPDDEDIVEHDPEDDACFVRFVSLEEAEAAASVVATALTQRAELERLAVIAQAHGWSS